MPDNTSETFYLPAVIVKDDNECIVPYPTRTTWELSPVKHPKPRYAKRHNINMRRNADTAKFNWHKEGK